jgi:hypothetical protein
VFPGRLDGGGEQRATVPPAAVGRVDGQLLQVHRPVEQLQDGEADHRPADDQDPPGM